MRKSGILLHISSLPNEYGIGTLGKEAYKFVDFLKKSGQTYWQMLPINPTSYGDSPYQSPSVFAGNPYFISVEQLVEDGLLEKSDLDIIKSKSNRVDYEMLFYKKIPLLKKAYQKCFIYQEEFELFCHENKNWLDEYALFMALKTEHDNKPFYEWYDDFKFRVDHAIEWFKKEYDKNINEHRFIQFLFYKQFIKLREYANKKGILLIGDMPIYCAYDSCDVWSAPKYFEVDSNLRQINVAGCPPDAFTSDGQLWGNPLYCYDVMKKDNYSWWVSRVKQMGKLFDVVRIDHFRGFAGFYSIAANEKTAKNGQWIKGPGYDLFKTIKENTNVDIIAENLGFLTSDVHRLLKKCGYPGMVIFQFELHNLKKKFGENNLIYSGTHDNQTIISFYNNLDEKNKRIVDKVCDINFSDRPNLKIIEFCMNQACDVCITPLQDLIGLSDTEGRMNIPSVPTGNWSYRARNIDFSKDLSEYLYKLTGLTNRL